MAPGCNHHFVVDAEESNEAVSRILKEENDHNFECHPEMPIITDEKMRSLVKKGVRKIE